MTENTNQTNHAQDLKNRLQVESAALAWLECGDRPIPANDTRHAMIKAKRDEILARLPPIRRFRKLRAKFTSNAECGHIIHRDEEFWYHNPGDGLGGWRCCSRCRSELKDNTKMNKAPEFKVGSIYGGGWSGSRYRVTACRKIKERGSK